MSTAMLVGPVGVVLLISLFRLRLRGHWCSSDPPGSRMKPAIFYCVEDIAAVDFMNGREFRTAMAARYATSARLDPHYFLMLVLITDGMLPFLSKAS